MLEAVAPDADILLTENEGAIRILRLNRPDKLNALNTALTEALHDALVAADEDTSVRAIVLAGNGRGFCAGADLSEFKVLTPANQHLVVRRADLSCRTYALLQAIRKPIVAAVQGVAMGGGAGLAIGCDMLVVGTGLKFGYPEMRHSIVPALVMATLQRHLGRKLAFEMISTGKLLGAEEVFATGLANQVTTADEVLPAAIEIARLWAASSPHAMAATKALFYRSADLTFAAAMEAGRDVNAIMRSFREPAA